MDGQLHALGSRLWEKKGEKVTASHTWSFRLEVSGVIWGIY